MTKKEEAFEVLIKLLGIHGPIDSKYGVTVWGTKEDAICISDGVAGESSDKNEAFVITKLIEVSNMKFTHQLQLHYNLILNSDFDIILQTMIDTFNAYVTQVR